MKLRAPFRYHQLLFTLAGLIAVGIVAPPLAHSQQAVINLKTGTRQQGEVTGVTASGVQLKMGANSITLPLNQIDSVQMAAPAEYGQAFQAFAANDLKKAQTLAAAVADRFKGLPTEWAKQSVVLLANVSIAAGDIPKAQAAVQDLERLYGPGTATQVRVVKGLIAAKKQDFAAAKELLEPVAEEALKEKNTAPQNALAYSQAFYALGQAKEGEGDFTGALEDYLRTVTLFWHDPAAASAARDRADALRRDKKVAVP